MTKTAAKPPQGNIKATREDWLNVAMDILISDGVAHLKITGLGERLGVSRSSFYWYFKSRKDLLEALLRAWEDGNTGIVQHHAALPARTITEAVCNLFRAFVDPRLFNHKLDFAVREWARRDGSVRRVIDRNDRARVAAITAMFARHGHSAADADVRARILYYQQIGYYALDLSEPLEERLRRVEGYVQGFTGQRPRAEEIAALVAYLRKALA
ncbi:TetR/AcrR family transcriptional regulator [Roseovarius carneus]|uniref:TetR/AcrR family transcriptional regulator n=1 Tax=Roseovarius carneus TaxID=2853164 RepID=UPI001CCBA8CD|nr:TetR/AcrR family transcriptional regulator [Roseovarius carneus]